MKRINLILSTIGILSAIIIGTALADAQTTFLSKLHFKHKKEANIGGIVECEGKPVKGVAVSDGYDIAITDKNGAYYLKSEKKNPQVFIIIPSGYMAWQEDLVPQFWAELHSPATTFERHDFLLKKTNDSNYGLIVTTDIHFHGKRNDEKTFKQYMEVIRREADNIKKREIPIYSIGLGDISHDIHWYETGVDIERTREILNENNWPAPFFNIMGNHDNDGAVCAGDSTDFLSARRYMKTYGPRYYSMNIGSIHFVMLDNIAYYNSPSNSQQYEKMSGKRNYKSMFTTEQLEWLRKDLSTVSHDTPIIIAMHSPVHLYKKASTEVLLNADKNTSMILKEIVKPFKKVHFISGHTHKNGITRVNNGGNQLIDHNLVSTCGNIWWNSPFCHPNIGHDGSPAGFDIYEIAGDNISWRFVPYDYEASQQFKVWDVNSLKKHFSTDPEALTLQRHFPEWGNYGNLPDNSVLLQVWQWDPEGKLSAKENGKDLKIEMVYEVHPDYYRYNAIQKAVWTGDYKKALSKPKRARMFLITGCTPKSPIEIVYTDAFGRKDRQSKTVIGNFVSTITGKVKSTRLNKK